MQKEDPTKLVGWDFYLTQILQMFYGFKKHDSPKLKKMPCYIDLPEKMTT
jgi:hypothetical protein